MYTTIRSSSSFLSFQIQCSDSKPSRGFGANNTNNNKTNKLTTSREDKGFASQQRESKTKQPFSVSPKAPRLSSRGDKKSKNSSLDVEFEERLKAVRRSALEQKKADEEKEFGAIDYDAPIASDNKTIGLGTKIGVGVAVLVFGLAFALGDFLPSGSVSPTGDSAVVNSKLSEEEKATLQVLISRKKNEELVVSLHRKYDHKLKEYETTLSKSPKDPAALEGAAVALTELGDYARATSLLDELSKEKPSDPDVFRLLGELKYELKDYEGSVAAYRSSAMVSKDINFEVLRGLTNSLLASKKPDEAVQFLLACKERLSLENLGNKADSSQLESQKLDPVQVELLLGKAYSDWGHISDAVAVYDQLISSHPDDFRGYLAKGVILKENKNIGDAERMFIQARFFAPDKAKALVDRYARQ